MTRGINAYTIIHRNDAYHIKKSQKNIIKHGLSFDDISMFEWDTAVTKQDVRRDYGESRFVSYGFINGRLHALIWTDNQF